MVEPSFTATKATFFPALFVLTQPQTITFLRLSFKQVRSLIVITDFLLFFTQRYIKLEIFFVGRDPLFYLSNLRDKFVFKYFMNGFNYRFRIIITLGMQLLLCSMVYKFIRNTKSFYSFFIIIINHKLYY